MRYDAKLSTSVRKRTAPPENTIMDQSETVFREPRPSPPASPRIKTWNRRVTTLGFAPMLIAGMLAAFIPQGQEALTIIGATGLIAVGLPVTLFAWRLRRENARRYYAALEEASTIGGRVRVVATDTGDNRYEVHEPEPITPIDWDKELTTP